MLPLDIVSIGVVKNAATCHIRSFRLKIRLSHRILAVFYFVSFFSSFSFFSLCLRSQRVAD